MKRLIVIALIFVVGVLVAYYYSRPTPQPLPIINPTDLEEEMVDPELLRIGQGHTIGSFSFRDQNGATITERSLRGKVFVVEYFFTTCGTICPKMNMQMRRIQDAYPSDNRLKILSFTVDPETDTVAQLKRYATAHHADDNQWHFLTGQKADLYKLARRSFFVLKPAEVENQGDVGSDFIHTNNFVLVDQRMRIRGYYDGTSSTEVTKLINDIKRLFDEN